MRRIMTAPPPDVHDNNQIVTDANGGDPMANITGNRVVHATLTANAVDTITLDADYVSVEIVNRDGSAEIYATVDTNITPTVGGAGCDVLPAAIGALTIDASGYGQPTIVKLISAGTPAYSVKGLPR